MPKKESSPEFYTLFYMGWTPKDLMALGFEKHSVYNYFRRYNKKIKDRIKYYLTKGQRPSIQEERGFAP